MADLSPAAAPSPRPPRLESLDVFRGMTIAGMVVVNDGGGPEAYRALRHAIEFNPSGHGCTPTDWIFPFFLFIMGVAMPFSFAARRAKGDGDGTLMGHVLKRSAMLFGLGLLLNSFPFHQLDAHALAHLRVTGILQRIALCYLFASPVALMAGPRGLARWSAALLAAYWALLTFVPVPGGGIGGCERGANLTEYLDRILLGSHARPNRELLGVLSTLPAIANTLLGVLAGHLLRSPLDAGGKIRRLAAAGVASALAGWAWGGCPGWLGFLGVGDPRWASPAVFPINKGLWTSSYVLFNCGLAAAGLAACLWLVDVRGWKRWALPFTVFGTNAIGAYVLSGLHAKLLEHITTRGGMTLKAWIYNAAFAPLASPMNASLLYALAFTGLWLGVMWVFYRKKWFWKI